MDVNEVGPNSKKSKEQIKKGHLRAAKVGCNTMY